MYCWGGLLTTPFRCKTICQEQPPKGKYMYEQGWAYCNVCERRFLRDKLLSSCIQARCPCCGNRMRTQANRPKRHQRYIKEARIKRYD